MLDGLLALEALDTELALDSPLGLDAELGLDWLLGPDWLLDWLLAELSGGLLELDAPPIAMLRAIGVPVADVPALARSAFVRPASFLRTAASCWISAVTKAADIRCRTMVLP